MIKIHPTAIIEENVKIGEGTSVWDNVHIRNGASIGEELLTKPTDALASVEVIEAAYKSLNQNLWQKVLEKTETAKK